MSNRLNDLKPLIDEHGSDKNWLLVTRLSDVRYVLNSPVPSSTLEWVFLFLSNKVNTILCDSRTNKILTEKYGDEFEIINKLVDKDVERFKSIVRNISDIEVHPSQDFTNMLKYLATNFDIIPTWADNWLINEARKIKSPDEIVLLRESQKINKEVLDKLIKMLRLWMNEQQIARKIQQLYFDYDTEWVSFEPIVVIWEWWSNPHHQNRVDRKLEAWDQILFDMWCLYKWYTSDRTRVVFTKKPNAQQEKIYSLLQEVTKKCTEYWKIWMFTKELDGEARALLGSYSKFFGHGLWHWVWLEEVHQSPTGKNLWIRHAVIFWWVSQHSQVNKLKKSMMEIRKSCRSNKKWFRKYFTRR